MVSTLTSKLSGVRDLKKILETTVKDLGETYKAECCQIVLTSPLDPNVTSICEYRLSDEGRALMPGVKMPLALQGRAFGQVALSRQEPLNTDEVNAIRITLAELGDIIRHAQINDVVQRDTFRDTFLVEIGNVMAYSLGIGDALFMVVNILGKVLNVSRCVFVCTDDTQAGWKCYEFWKQNEVASCRDYHWPTTNSALVAQTLLNESPLAVFEGQPNSYMSPVQEELQLIGARSYLGVPLLTEHSTHGCVILQQCDYRRHWTRQEIDLVQKVADKVAETVAKLPAEKLAREPIMQLHQRVVAAPDEEQGKQSIQSVRRALKGALGQEAIPQAQKSMPGGMGMPGVQVMSTARPSTPVAPPVAPPVQSPPVPPPVPPALPVQEGFMAAPPPETPPPVPSRAHLESEVVAPVGEVADSAILPPPINLTPESLNVEISSGFASELLAGGIPEVAKVDLPPPIAKTPADDEPVIALGAPPAAQEASADLEISFEENIQAPPAQGKGGLGKSLGKILGGRGASKADVPPPPETAAQSDIPPPQETMADIGAGTVEVNMEASVAALGEVASPEESSTSLLGEIADAVEQIDSGVDDTASGDSLSSGAAAETGASKWGDLNAIPTPGAGASGAHAAGADAAPGTEPAAASGRWGNLESIPTPSTGSVIGGLGGSILPKMKGPSGPAAQSSLLASFHKDKARFAATETASPEFVDGPPIQVDDKQAKAKIQEALAKANPLSDFIFALPGLDARTLGRIDGWISEIESKDKYVNGHVKAVAEYAVAIAKQAGLSEEEINHVRLAAVLHDVGKRGLSGQILQKPDEDLTDPELILYMNHPADGADLVSSFPELAHVAADIRAHHENYDGMGYPDGLENGMEKERIPQAARIIHVADSYVLLTSDLKYRKGMNSSSALEHMNQQAGKEFDPRFVEMLMLVVMQNKVPA